MVLTFWKSGKWAIKRGSIYIRVVEEEFERTGLSGSFTKEPLNFHIFKWTNICFVLKDDKKVNIMKEDFGYYLHYKGKRVDVFSSIFLINGPKRV